MGIGTSPGPAVTLKEIQEALKAITVKLQKITAKLEEITKATK